LESTYTKKDVLQRSSGNQAGPATSNILQVVMAYQNLLTTSKGTVMHGQYVNQLPTTE
jgi:hypothetical protein